MPKSSFMIFFIHNISLHASIADIYSCSVVESTTKFLQFRLPWNCSPSANVNPHSLRWTFLESISPPKSDFVMVEEKSLKPSPETLLCKAILKIGFYTLKEFSQMLSARIQLIWCFSTDSLNRIALQLCYNNNKSCKYSADRYEIVSWISWKCKN